ncbi:MAG: prenyltransferase/squalene oxidase repeat-containing protein [Candidatus Methanofastidiosia archaeon]
MGFDLDKAISYIFENGHELDTYRLEFILGLGRDDKVPINILKKYQNEDGGFALDFKEENPSSLSKTLSIFPCFLELDIGYTGCYKRCLNFILEKQALDGSWDENEEISNLHPPKWTVPGALPTKLWITAQAASDLLYYEKMEFVAKKALSFLRKHRNDDGSFKGYFITNWIVLSIYAMLELKKEANTMFAIVKTESENNPEFLVWHLECLKKTNIGTNLANKLLDQLEKMQEKNGSWQTAEESSYSPTITVDVLKTLKIWNRF